MFGLFFLCGGRRKIQMEDGLQIFHGAVRIDFKVVVQFSFGGPPVVTLEDKFFRRHINGHRFHKIAHDLCVRSGRESITGFLGQFRIRFEAGHFAEP